MAKKLFCFLLTALLAHHISHAQIPVVFNGQPVLAKPMNIAGQTFFYEDLSNDALSFAALKKQIFVPLPEQLLHPVVSSRPFIINWLKFSISNVSGTDTTRLVFSANAHAFVSMYEDGSNALAANETGALHKIFADEPGKPLIVPPGKTNTYYVRIIEKIFYMAPLTAELYTVQGYLAHTAREKKDAGYLFLFMGIALGCIFFMALYTAYQYWLTKDKPILYYTAYATCAGIVWLIICDQRFDLHIFDAWKNHPHIIVSSGIAFFYALFIASMLDVPKRFPGRWKILKVLLCLILLETLVEVHDNLSGHFLFGSNVYYLHLLHIPNLLVNLFLFYLLLTIKSPLKKYLLGGMLSLFLFLFFISHFAFSFTDLPEKVKAFVNFPPFWGVIGVLTEAICFAFALVYRSKLVQDEKNKLQAGYANKLKTDLAQQAQEIEQQHRLLEDEKLKQVEAAFQKKISETEMTALRAQMNPHFIFNCLNSIQLYTLENDAASASVYLTGFSRLMRLVLDNSMSEKVTLKNEIETLRLYIEMEVMRFKDKVRYEITLDDNVDLPYIEVPPLLLQPYVENAIWHGLMHKEEGGKVTIAISQPLSHILHIEITDNGVGRTMSALYKSKSINRHKSFGIKMTTERLQVINQLYDMQTRIDITDLQDDKGNASGTKVIIDIPI